MSEKEEGFKEVISSLNNVLGLIEKGLMSRCFLRLLGAILGSVVGIIGIR